MPRTLNNKAWLTVEALTVAEVREVLATLPDDFVLTYRRWDSEEDIVFLYAVTGISESGRIEASLFDSEVPSDF